MEKLTLQEIRKLAESQWERCHGCDETDKQMWINGFITGTLANQVELPSDEEIEEAAIKIVNEHCDSQSGDLTVEVECFEAGVYWIKKQILNQNK